MFDFRLKVFHTVAKRLSFTKAATELFITQPAVTKHIKELEQYFKVQLFERKGNQIKLTNQGQLMLQYTEQLFTIYRKMEFDLNSFSDNHKGLLHLGASTTISQYVIPSALAEFHKKYKDIKVKLLNGNTEQIEHALLNNDIDLGIIEGKSKNKGIKYTKYVKDEIVLVSKMNNPFAKNRPVTIEELKNIPLLVRETGSGTLDVIAYALKPFNLTFSQLNIEMDLGSTEAIKTYLQSSNCMAFLSVHSIANELSNNIFQIIDVAGLQIERFFYFIERQGTSEQLANLFMQFASHYNLK
ncbi:LysR family transcriptional regulator [Segetibacter koreensis]|uniref:LysR family transcriptional regulator n=1 Tax=Segetibacter koreensis TaxID=398037 RepID=UPI0003A8190C|nr:LysR family transcriptional regulator [Segetibacter koreensis]